MTTILSNPLKRKRAYQNIFLNKRLHIFITTAWYKDVDGSPNFVEEQARMLQRKGHKVAVLHSYLKGTFVKNLRSRRNDFSVEDDNGITTVRIGVPPILPKARALAYKSLKRKCSDYFIEYIAIYGKPNIIHSHSLFMGGLIGCSLSKQFNIPFFHTEHTSGFIFNPKQYTKSDIRILKKVYQKAASVFFVSQFARSKMQEFYKLESDNLSVLNNIVNPLFFSPLIKEIESDNKFNYLLIGGLIPVKGIELLLSSWQKLLKSYPESKLTIVGQGHLKNSLVKEAATLKISESVSWIASMSREEIVQQIDSCQVVVSTSKLETFGLTVAESGARGKPVVVTDSGGVRDVVTERTGLIVSQNSEALADGLIDIQKDYNKYQKKEIRGVIMERFSEERIYIQLMNYYTQSVEL